MSTFLYIFNAHQILLQFRSSGKIKERKKEVSSWTPTSCGWRIWLDCWVSQRPLWRRTWTCGPAPPRCFLFWELSWLILFWVATAPFSLLLLSISSYVSTSFLYQPWALLSTRSGTIQFKYTACALMSCTSPTYSFVLRNLFQRLFGSGNIDLACGQNWIGGNNMDLVHKGHLTKSFLWVTFIEIIAFSFLTKKKSIWFE